MAKVENWISKNIKALHQRYYDAYFKNRAQVSGDNGASGYAKSYVSSKYKTKYQQRERLKKAMLDEADTMLRTKF